MPEKLVAITTEELKKKLNESKWLTDYGSYNKIPKPFSKLDHFSFIDVMSRGTPDYIEYREICTQEGDSKVYVPAYIYWFEDNGILILLDTNASMVEECYLIGCEHTFDEIIGDMGKHTFVCRECGYSYDEWDEIVVDNPVEVSTDAMQS